MSIFIHLQQKWNKFTHIFVTSTNSPTTHPVFTHLKIMARSTRALGYLSAGEVWRWGSFCIRGCWWRSCLPPRRFTVRQRYPKHVHSSENGSPPSKLIRSPSKAHSHLFTTLARFLLRGFLCGAKDCGAKPRKMPRIFLPAGVHVTLYRTPIFLPAEVRVTLYPQDHSCLPGIGDTRKLSTSRCLLQIFKISRIVA